MLSQKVIYQLFEINEGKKTHIANTLLTITVDAFRCEMKGKNPYTELETLIENTARYILQHYKPHVKGEITVTFHKEGEQLV